jgi:hypothetical protein
MSCWPWKHEWTKWERVGVGNIVKPEEPTTVVGVYEQQRRECSKCGMCQLREERA